MQTIFAARLGQHASNLRALPAVAMPGREITYAELLGRVQRCAAWLAREPHLSSGPVGVTVADEVSHLVASLALLWLGIPHVALPTGDPLTRRLDIAERLAVGCVIVSDPRYALPGRGALLMTPETHERTACAAPPDAIIADPDAPAIYYTSSGVTGEPKIYALSQRALTWRAESIHRSEQIGPEYRSHTPVSIEDPMAKSRFITCTYLGVTSAFAGGRASTPLSIQELCASLRVTCLELSILQISSLLQDAADLRPIPAHTTVYTAGAMVSRALRQQFKARFGVPLFVHYGAREFGRITSTFPDGDDDNIETVGMPVPWIDLEIVDGDGRALPQGELGEIRVRCEHMTREYHRDPLATARHFRDGWFYPGDFGSRYAGGALCLHGRSDDMMNLNGIKIFPAEIERVLEEHPDVRAAAAFSRSSEAHGDIPMAAVELHASAVAGVEELMACVRERLGVRAPRKIIVLETMPRNAAGKVLKRELAALLASGT
jgi:acyl-coenzyme A synthetase/AMP-(fatty) acid ligase